MGGMILYHGEPNGPSLTVLATLFETGLDVELRPIDLLKGERHTIPGLSDRTALDMNVEGEGPVLVVDGPNGGEALTDSVFIAQFLDELAGAGLQPADPFHHWEMLMWCRRTTERGAPAAAFLNCREFARPVLAAMDDGAFDALAGTIASDDLRARWIAIRNGEFADGQVEDSIAKVIANAEMVEQQLADGRDWLMGDFSLADLLPMVWADLEAVVPDALSSLPRTRAWQARLRERPSVRRALALATVPHPERHWAPGPEINRWG